jgi:dTDP-4-dehydrorhamnose reductase
MGGARMREGSNLSCATACLRPGLTFGWGRDGRIIVKILVTGGAGFIGPNFVRYLLHARRGVEVFNFDKLTYTGNTENLVAIARDPDITSYAATLPTSGRRSMKSYVSADYVFDGASHRPYEPDDPIHPLNVYGVSKAAGENAVREESKHWLITRTWWLFGASRTSFPERILRRPLASPRSRSLPIKAGR